MIFVTFSSFVYEKFYSINLIKITKNDKEKNANVQNKKESFIYNIYYLTEPYTYFLVRGDSKRARGGR